MVFGGCCVNSVAMPIAPSHFAQDVKLRLVHAEADGVAPAVDAKESEQVESGGDVRAGNERAVLSCRDYLNVSKFGAPQCVNMQILETPGVR